MKRIWFAVTVAAASLILGTGSMAVGKQLPPSPDELLAREIWMRLRTAPHLENDRITVDVDDGIAVLEGTVASAAHKKVGAAAGARRGVLGVNNRLRVWVFDESRKGSGHQRCGAGHGLRQKELFPTG